MTRQDGRDRSEYYKEYYRKNREKLIKENNDRARKKGRQGEHYLSRYGITKETYDQMFLDQSGVCAICGKSPGKVRLAIDHDHITGEIRGLLCSVCNNALHYLENEEWLREAVLYLRSYGYVPRDIRVVE